MTWSRYWEIRAHLGLSERAPGVQERYSQGVHHSSAAIEIGNPNLRKETTLKTELHLHGRYDIWSIEARLYHQLLDRFIYSSLQSEPRLTIRGAFPLLLYEQHNSVLYGTAVVWRYRPWSWIEYSFQISLIRGWNKELHQPLINIPSDRLKQYLKLKWKVLSTPTELRITYQFVDKQYRYPKDLDLSTPPLSYHLFALSLSVGPWRVGSSKCQLSLGTDNLFNQRYRDYLNGFRYFADEPGRNLWLRLTWFF